jgi:quinol-cytochrome oxidoreductase complex cytochrome b subunit
MAHAPHEQKPGVMGWVEYRLPIFGFAKGLIYDFPAPRNLNYFWNFGSMAAVMLISQILTGLFLAMHYAANTAVAFDSVEHIMRDVNYGWLIRYMHAVGASMFFGVVFCHIFRGLYYGSYKAPREVLWWIGVVILILMMATAFMGYVLPWGQMSFWGATVITNLFSAFPIVGEPIVSWLWGGFSVDNPTLNRFFALHFLLPFVLAGAVFLHVIALHTHGSNNPTGIAMKGPQDSVPFHPYYTVKDFFGLGVFFLLFSAFIFFAPNYLGHPDNYIPADPLVTPAHIVPEWYFLPFYAMLRAIVFDIPFWILGLPLIALAFVLRYPACTRSCASKCPLGVMPVFASFLPAEPIKRCLFWGMIGGGIFLTILGFGGVVIESKLAGVLTMFGALLILLVIPWLDFSPVRSCNYRPIMRIFFWILVVDSIVLGYCGSKPPEGIYPILSLIGTAYYFAYFIVLMPVISRIEKPLPLPESIAASVLAKNHAAH